MVAVMLPMHVMAGRNHFAIKNRVLNLPAIIDTPRYKVIKGLRIELVEPKKIKEVAKAKHQLKPVKVNTTTPPPTSTDTTAAVKPKIKPPRQRRPEGLERPPEIPRRNE